MLRNITETTLRVYKSLGYNENEIWAMLDKTAQKHGFRNYGEINTVLSPVKKYITDPCLAERVRKCKEKYGISLKDMTEQINKEAGYRAVTYKYFTKMFGGQQNHKKTDDYTPELYDAIDQFLRARGC